MNKPIRTRFAPSPTGLLHIGGVRTALFSYLFAKANKGQFILRLEDTDRERFVESGIEQIIKSLDWVGIEPDEGVWYEEKPGVHGPYVQSKRLPRYKEIAEKLVTEGKAYYSAISPEEFSSLREKAIQEKRPFVYKKSMEPNMIPDSTDGLPIRLSVPEGKTNWKDEIRGEFTIDNSQIDDFILIKADGYPTYNFANVVDDHLMQISHVIRGDEFISSTAKHALLFDLLGFDRPAWVHLAPILGPDGKKKLSKRDGDVDVLEYERKGYLKEALINFLALLGWNDGTEKEIFTMTELINTFSIGRIQKSPAAFDIQRLDWMNGEYIRSLSIDELAGKIKAFVPAEWLDDMDYFKAVLKLDSERLKRLDEAEYVMEIFFQNSEIDEKILTQKNSLTEISAWFKDIASILQDTDFSHDKLETALRGYATDNSINAGNLFFALRVALTGRTQAPGLFDILATLGKEESLSRIKSIYE